MAASGGVKENGLGKPKRRAAAWHHGVENK